MPGQTLPRQARLQAAEQQAAARVRARLEALAPARPELFPPAVVEKAGKTLESLLDHADPREKRLAAVAIIEHATEASRPERAGVTVVVTDTEAFVQALKRSPAATKAIDVQATRLDMLQAAKTTFGLSQQERGANG